MKFRDPFLERLAAAGDPVAQALLDAPEDDEPVTEEDLAAVRERDPSTRLTAEEVRRRLGLPPRRP